MKMQRFTINGLVKKDITNYFLRKYLAGAEEIDR